LLKNEDNLLPLSRSIKRLAVIGPNADNVRGHLGDYHFPAHAELVLLRGTSRADASPEQLAELEEIERSVRIVTVLEGVRNHA
jgi:beta-glucosidase